MHDSSVISQGVIRPEKPWLLLIHQIPPKPDYFRVKVRRRLQRIGAVALKNSVYVLPATDDAMEDFQWLRRAIVDEGGEATLYAGAFVEGLTDEEVVSMFRHQSDEEYRELMATARATAGPTESDLRRLQRHLDQIESRDFFQAPAGHEARRAVADLEASATGGPDIAASPSPALGAPHGVTWVTRTGVYVDRVASAWLIRRFIDPAARFKFVPATGYSPEPSDLRFDMYEGEYTHEGDACTFEVLRSRFGLDDPALGTIAEIVHDIDCKDEKFGRAEAAGVATVLRGIIVAHADDDARLEAGRALFDGLYESQRIDT